MVEFYSLTFPRFPLQKKEHKSYFGKNRTHDFRTSRCAGYLLDHSSNERNEINVTVPLRSESGDLYSFVLDLSADRYVDKGLAMNAVANAQV